MPEPGGRRPDPVRDPGPPQAGLGRHAGVGFEVLLDVRVPQYAREVDEEPWSNLLKKVAAVDRRREREKAQEKEAYDKKMWELNRKVTAGILVSAEEMAAWRRWSGLGPFSSMEGIKRKKRKRRKKYLPKTHSSSHLLQNSVPSTAVTGYSGFGMGLLLGMEEGEQDR